MTIYQLNFYGGEEKIKPRATKKDRRNWKNAFQRWSNRKGMNEPTTTYGKCGYGSMCEYCDDNTYGRPCVRALNALSKEQKITIDYTTRNFEDIWDGEFNRKREVTPCTNQNSSKAE